MDGNGDRAAADREVDAHAGTHAMTRRHLFGRLGAHAGAGALLAGLGGPVLTTAFSSVSAAADGDAAPAQRPSSPAPLETEPSALRRVSMVGDSITVDALAYQADAFSAAGWTSCDIDAYDGRGILHKRPDDPRNGYEAVDEIRRRAGDTETWVVALGSNDATQHPPREYRGLIDLMLDRIGPGHRVVWVDVYLPSWPVEQAEWNATLRQVRAERLDAMVILDWSSLASVQDSWITFDRVHYTEIGSSRRATAVALATVPVNLDRLAARAVAADPPLVTSVGDPLGFDTIEPIRVLDSRLGSARFAAGDVRTIDLSGVIPSGARAVALNIAAVDPGADGYLTIWASGTGRPLVSSNSFVELRTISSHTISGVSADRRLDVFANAETDVVIDVFGWFAADGPLSLQARAPQRLADTRETSVRLDAGSSIDIVVPGVGGLIPRAAFVSVAVTNVASPGFLTMWPTGRPRPLASNLNSTPLDVAIANTAHVALDEQGRFTVFTSGDAAVVVDLLGVYDESGTGLRYLAATPTRILDSRTGLGGWQGSLVPGQMIDVPVPAAGSGPMPRTVVGTLSATVAATGGYVVAWSGDEPVPPTSTLNLDMSRVVSTFTMSALGRDGSIALQQFAGSGDSIIFDVTGWFV